jgi:hypothetical protein
MGIPEYEARAVVLLSVHCETSDQISRAKDFLNQTNQTGAEDISSAGERAASSHGVNTETATSTRV